MLFDKIGKHAEFETASLQQVREKTSLFGALDNQQLERLLSYMGEKSFHSGEVIFSQGDVPCNIYILYCGQVHLSIVKETGALAAMDFFPGDCFGESAVIGIQPQIGDATALSNAKALTLSTQGLIDLLENDADLLCILMMNIAREVSRRLHTSMTAADTSENFKLAVVHSC